ncbi:LysR family transcriptional regulator [Megamonas sp.]
MEFRLLKYFLIVAREENITRAANWLHITQPTLSRQLMQLEDELGVKLFKRSKHRIILTDDGMMLKRRAQEIMSLVEKTKQDFVSEDEELAGKISIGCGETRNMSFLSNHIKTFMKFIRGLNMKFTVRQLMILRMIWKKAFWIWDF